MTILNDTHDPARKSSVKSANAPGCEFPIQNLPFGIFSVDGAAQRPGVAIGDMIVDLVALQQSGALTGDADAAAVAAGQGPGLNALMALGNGPASALRAQLSDLLDANSKSSVEIAKFLVPMQSVQMHLPAKIGDFTDFLTSSYHMSRMRGTTELLPNFMSLPIAYHSRASSVQLSGNINRPYIQYPIDDVAVFGPTTKFDYELEIGVFIGKGNELGKPIRIDEAEDHMWGFCITNDWSLRDAQYFEGQPLGPFLSKSLGTTISAWVITEEAMRPYRVPARPRDEGHPAILPHLASDTNSKSGAIDLHLEAHLQTDKMRENGGTSERLTRSNLKNLYWTFAQMVTHHSSNGCNLMPGDLLASGTCSGPEDENRACLAEISVKGTVAIDLENGESRTFLEDGDEISITAVASRDGFASIGFGSAIGRVLPAIKY